MKLPVLTLNQKLATVAVALGALALFSVPHRGPVVTLDTRELAQIVEKEVDHVTPSELAAHCRAAGLSTADITGLAYNPLTKEFSLGKDAGVNYFFAARRG